MEESELKKLRARLSDLAAMSERGITANTAFLSPSEQKYGAEWINHMGFASRAFFYGGYPHAERKCVFFLPDFYEASVPDITDFNAVTSVIGEELEEKIKAIEICGSGFRTLSHRDYLGALLNLGIDRAALGDICPTSDFSSVVFAAAPVAALIMTSCDKIGADKVKVKILPENSGFKYERKTKPVCGTVASDRFDSVLASLIGESREKAKEKILAGFAELCGETVTKPDARVSPGDTVSARGHGKFIIDDITSETKKGRIRLVARKYI